MSIFESNCVGRILPNALRAMFPASTPPRSSTSVILVCEVEITVYQLSGDAQDGEASVERDVLSGVWVTNQGILDLSHSDDGLSETLDRKTKVSGKLDGDAISLQYKRGAYPTNVSLKFAHEKQTKMARSWMRQGPRIYLCECGQFCGHLRSVASTEASNGILFSAEVIPTEASLNRP